MLTSHRLIHRVQPHVHEDLFGFLMRAAERNHLEGLGSILSYVTGSEQTSIRLAHLPRLAEFCRNHLEEVQQLSGIERRYSDGSRAWQVNGEWISKSCLIATRRVKVCPLCLQESPHIRGLWPLSFYTVCSKHDVHLIHHCPACSRALKWNRRHVQYCACGFDLAASPTMVALGPARVFAKLIARQPCPDVLALPGCLPPSELERLAKLSLDGLCKTIWFLGHCLAELGRYGVGHGRLRPAPADAEVIIANAMDLLRAWPDRLGERLELCTQRTPIDRPGSLVEKLLGPVQHYLLEELQTDELAFVRVAYEQHLLSIWRTFGYSHRLKNAERQLELDLR